ncbi:Uu.00g119210.m01.CDS01 [Anthostomella pinea]|uniref:Uu.00g119210.m01.CDS01 n=1 Tax=Anthostomella pinea TaxID=933095 RepID=A0AAI8VGL7_9PEZI|nr:Uu.00g119210.m01.CDS01 [Anthostomella pinea]
MHPAQFLTTLLGVFSIGQTHGRAIVPGGVENYETPSSVARRDDFTMPQATFILCMAQYKRINDDDKKAYDKAAKECARKAGEDEEDLKKDLGERNDQNILFPSADLVKKVKRQEELWQYARTALFGLTHDSTWRS